VSLTEDAPDYSEASVGIDEPAVGSGSLLEKGKRVALMILQVEAGSHRFQINPAFTRALGPEASPALLRAHSRGKYPCRIEIEPALKVEKISTNTGGESALDVEVAAHPFVASDASTPADARALIAREPRFEACVRAARERGGSPRGKLDATLNIDGGRLLFSHIEDSAQPVGPALAVCWAGVFYSLSYEHFGYLHVSLRPKAAP
jgi:hypothetical protein